MFHYAPKVTILALLIVTISEIAKRSMGFAALVASLPLTALLAFVRLHMEASSPNKIADLSSQIFWLVLPSLLLFLCSRFFSGMAEAFGSVWVYLWQRLLAATLRCCHYCAAWGSAYS